MEGPGGHATAAEVVERELLVALRAGLPLSRVDTPALVAALLPPEAMQAPTGEASAEGRLERIIQQSSGMDTDSTLALFGFGKGAQLKNLTSRRQLAASLAGYEVHHYRKRIEPRVIARLAYEVEQLADARGWHLSVRPPFLRENQEMTEPSDFLEALALDRERLISEIWAAAFALHAVLIELALSSRRVIDAHVDLIARRAAAIHLRGVYMSLFYEQEMGDLDASGSAVHALNYAGKLPMVRGWELEHAQARIDHGATEDECVNDPQLAESFYGSWLAFINDAHIRKETNV